MLLISVSNLTNNIQTFHSLPVDNTHLISASRSQLTSYFEARLSGSYTVPPPIWYLPGLSGVQKVTTSETNCALGLALHIIR